jgi:hypothetical protein
MLAPLASAPFTMENDMKRRTILFAMNTKTPDAQISDAAEAAAQNDTRLICLLIDGAPDSPLCV